MNALSLFLVLAAAPPQVEISTLKGEQHVGALERLSAEEAHLKTPTGMITVAAADLLAVRIANGAPAAPPSESSIEIRLVDATRLHVATFSSSGTEATLTHPHLGSVKLPITAVQSVRFAAPDAKVDAAWNQLLERSPKKDQVAVRKADVLDHLDGVIGSLDEATVKFQLEGDEIAVKRERVFGLIYSRREAAASAKGIATVELPSGDRLSAKSVVWDGEIWKVKLVSGSDLSIPLSVVQTIDFSIGKIAYLSNLEPRDVKYTPFWENTFVWEYRRDRGPEGNPLSLGNKTYAKGLSIHSRTMMKYRLGADYRRFQAVMGIDDVRRVGGDVDVVIKGDGRILFKGPVSIYERIDPKAANSASRRLMPPQPLDLDVSGVVELEIVVDYGEMSDIGDWLDLADARVVK